MTTNITTTTTPCTSPQPKPKLRTKRRAPIALLRTAVPKKVSEKLKKIKKLVEEIAPYCAPSEINKFKRNLKFISKAEIIQKKEALKNNALSFEAIIVNNYDPSIQLADTRKILKEKLKTLINEKRKGLKFNVTLKVRLRKERKEGTIYKEPYFTSSTMTITYEDEIPEKLEQAEEQILERIATWISEGSRWIIKEILNHYINVVFYVPLRGNSYIPLPKNYKTQRKDSSILKTKIINVSDGVISVI